jgi:hypothetical protein
MKSINELRDFGLKKKCLIVGGGHSVNDFAFDKINGMYVIATNKHLSQMASMIIYYDTDMDLHFEKNPPADRTILVGWKQKDSRKLCSRCNYFYNTINDVMFGDTGFMSLQIADRILNFNEIYLTGFDYNTKKKSYHYDEVESDKKKMNDFKLWSIGKVLPMIENYSPLHTVYNCSKESSIKQFQYKLPYKE